MLIQRAAKRVGVSITTAYTWCRIVGLAQRKFGKGQQKKEKFLELIKQGIKIKVAARQLGVADTTAYKYCKETGTPYASDPRGGMNNPSIIKARKRWEGVDWTKQDTDIGRELGVSRERARQIRKLKGHGPSLNHRQHTQAIRFRAFLQTTPLEGAKKSVREMSKEFDTSELTVWSQLKKFGVKPLPGNSVYHKINKENLKSFCSIHPRTYCWEVEDLPYTNGHPRFGGKYARHVVYNWFKGEVPKGVLLGSTCFNSRCLNPAHLCTMTKSELLTEARARGR